MNANDEVAPPTSPSLSDPTGLPIPVSDVVLSLSPPTPAAVLAWVGSAGGEPWFPSDHAAATRTDRDALDDPLGQLRRAGLVRVATWVRGRGQGYTLTAAGEAAAATGVGVPPAAADPAPPPADPSPADRLDLDPRPPLVVPVLLVVNALWFFVGAVVAVRGGHRLWPYLSGADSDVLHRLGSVTGADLAAGEWWRLATSCFVHVGGLHLLVNLFALAMMGPLAELLWGRKRLAVIYAASGLAGACLAMGLKPGVPLAGASGAIWGVLASLAAWLLLYRSRLPADVAGDWARRLWVVLVLNAGLSFLPGISWQAHLGGGAAGFVAAGLLSAFRWGGGWRLVALVCLVALPVGCVGGLVLAMHRGEAWAEVGHAAERWAAAARAAARAGEGGAVWEAYRAAAQPRLDRLSPAAVGSNEKRAVLALSLPPGERRDRATAPLRAWAAEAKADAGALAAVPPGPGSTAAPWPQVRGFAEARGRSLGLLLKMLDGAGPPDAAAWEAWGASRRDADARWAELPRR